MKLQVILHPKKMVILLGQTRMYLEKYAENEKLKVSFLLPESTQGKSKRILFNVMKINWLYIYFYYFNTRKKELL